MYISLYLWLYLGPIVIICQFRDNLYYVELNISPEQRCTQQRHAQDIRLKQKQY